MIYPTTFPPVFGTLSTEKMINFYSRAPDNPSTGSPVYAQSVLRFYYQYFLSGIVEIRPVMGGQIVVLVAEGHPVGAYIFEQDRYSRFPVEQLPQKWSAGEANIRSVNLPREALRVTAQILEWYPSYAVPETGSRLAQEYIMQCQTDKTSGVLCLNWPEADGYVSFINGNLIQSETVYSGSSDVEAGILNFRVIFNKPESVLSARCFMARPDTDSATQQGLRIAMLAWGRFVLDRYLQLVGRNLTKALTGELNRLTRSKSWYIQIVGDTLVDSHVFPSTDAAVQAYQYLIKALAFNMVKVIGVSLTNSIFNEGFDNLQDCDQQTLRAYSLVLV
jgi:hypothetical protein